MNNEKPVVALPHAPVAVALPHAPVAVAWPHAATPSAWPHSASATAGAPSRVRAPRTPEPVEERLAEARRQIAALGASEPT